MERDLREMMDLLRDLETRISDQRIELINMMKLNTSTTSLASRRQSLVMPSFGSF